MVLILGATGFIGSHLYAFFKKKGVKVSGTYHSNHASGLIPFHLGRSSANELLDGEKIDFAVIAVKSYQDLDDYKRLYEDACFIDASCIKAFLDACFERGIFTVYISTDNVFDGNRGNYREEDLRNPVNCYGMTRYEVENHILGSSNPSVILRIGKAFGTKLDDKTLFTNIFNWFQEGTAISFIKDQIITPVYVHDLASFVYDIYIRKYTGVFHVASLQPTTRFDIANSIKDHFGFRDARITSVEFNSLDLLDKRPLRINLDIAKYKGITGVEEKDIQFYLEKIS